MDGASKDIQGSSELISQLVKTSQATGDSEKATTLPKLPFGLSISPKEFCILKDKDFWHSTQHSYRVKLKAEKIS